MIGQLVKVRSSPHRDDEVYYARKYDSIIKETVAVEQGTVGLYLGSVHCDSPGIHPSNKDRLIVLIDEQKLLFRPDIVVPL